MRTRARANDMWVFYIYVCMCMYVSMYICSDSRRRKQHFQFLYKGANKILFLVEHRRSGAAPTSDTRTSLNGIEQRLELNLILPF